MNYNINIKSYINEYLKKHEYKTDDNDTECLICRNDFKDDSESIKLDCNQGCKYNVYHKKCILEWFKIRYPNIHCPYCQHYIKIDEELVMEYYRHSQILYIINKSLMSYHKNEHKKIVLYSTKILIGLYVIEIIKGYINYKNCYEKLYIDFMFILISIYSLSSIKSLPTDMFFGSCPATFTVTTIFLLTGIIKTKDRILELNDNFDNMIMVYMFLMQFYFYCYSVFISKLVYKLRQTKDIPINNNNMVLLEVDEYNIRDMFDV